MLKMCVGLISVMKTLYQKSLKSSGQYIKEMYMHICVNYIILMLLN